MLSAGVDALGQEMKAAALIAMHEFSSFNDGDDVRGEHDFGAFKLGHYTFVFKVDYYDAELIGASEDPADPQKTTRVLTLMLSGDW